MGRDRNGHSRLAYFVHDVHDAAVARRVRMMHAGGADVTVVGFRRREAPLAAIDGAPVIDLGRTGDGRFAQRVAAVGRALISRARVRRAIAGCDAIVARNLESLAIAASVRGRRRLTYECLDIHRLLLGGSVAAKAVQAVEWRLLAAVDLIVTSSPQFADYFTGRRGFRGPVLLAENKVLALDGAAAAPAPRPAGPPWVIGWFGMLRCRRSFEILKAIAIASGGRIEVLIAGIASEAEFTDFAAQCEAAPGVRFAGRYAADDLPALYGAVHFAWAIDYFEEGLNSAWLLPNRLYESLSFGAVPIALSTVETGAWLRANGVGVLVDDPAREVPALLSGLDASGYSALAARAADLPRALIFAGIDEARDLTRAMLGAV